MAKRFLDTSIFRDPSVRAMKAPYKVLYLYLLCECDHAGVWICEMDVAALRLGMKLGGRDEVLAELAGAVIDLGGGAWYVVDFVRSQYGKLNPANRVHASVMDRLQGLGMDPLNLPENKPLKSPLQGDKDKDKDKDNSEKKGREVKEHDATFEAVWVAYQRKGSKGKALEYWRRLTLEDRAAITAKIPAYVDSTSGERLVYRKNLEGWINPDERRWEAPIIEMKAAPPGPMTKAEADAEMRAIRVSNGRDPVFGAVYDEECSRALLVYRGVVKA